MYHTFLLTTFAALLLLSCDSAIVAKEKRDSIILNNESGFTVRLGQTQQEITASCRQLPQPCRVYDTAPDTGAPIGSEVIVLGGPERRNLWSFLEFRSDRLVRATRRWAQFVNQPDATRLAQSLTGLVESRGSVTGATAFKENTPAVRREGIRFTLADGTKVELRVINADIVHLEEIVSSH